MPLWYIIVNSVCSAIIAFSVVMIIYYLRSDK